MKSIEKSAKSGPKKDLFKFESVNTSMGHTVGDQKVKFYAIIYIYVLPSPEVKIKLCLKLGTVRHGSI